jgi:hypothetical protein
MAIISIPTSIGGVAIPGGLLKGPLGKLFGKGGADLLQYPADLANNPTRAHSVVFSIFEIEPLNTDEKKLKTLDAITGELKESVTAALKPPISKNAATISLYMPDSLNMQYNAGYQEFSFTESAGVAGRIAQTALDAVTQAATGGFKETAKNLITGPAGLEVAGKLSDKVLGTQGAGDILLRAGGYALNPQMQLIFKGIALRTFQLEFIFTPKSRDEAQSVKKIIETFTYHMSPGLVGAAGGGQGQYFTMPSVFKIDFKFAGPPSGIMGVLSAALGSLGGIGSMIAPLLPGSAAGENENLYKVGECVLEDMNIDYAPNGWASHMDGAPVQTKLTLTFKEMDIIHRDRLKKKEVR